MSTFNVHEWNQKRRLAELAPDKKTPLDVMGSKSSPDLLKDESINSLQNAIAWGSSTGLISKAQELILDTIATSMIKKRAKELGDM